MKKLFNPIPFIDLDKVKEKIGLNSVITDVESNKQNIQVITNNEQLLYADRRNPPYGSEKFLEKLESITLNESGDYQEPATNTGARKFMVSFIDDDSIDKFNENTELTDPKLGGFYSRLHPVVVAASRNLSKKIKFNEAAVASPPNFDDGMESNILTLQNEYGWEFQSHSVTHDRDRVTNPEYFEEELLESKLFLEAKGLNIESYVYPFGDNDHPTRRYISQHYRSAFTTTGGPCSYPLRTLKLERYGIDGGSTVVNDSRDLAGWKAKVDEAKANNQWLVFVIHAYKDQWRNDNPDNPDGTYPDNWRVPVGNVDGDPLAHEIPDGWYPHPNTLLSDLYDLINYIDQESGEIVTVSEGLDRVDNLVMVGDYENTRTNPHYVIGVDGSKSYYSP